jgi:exopolysaccharide biosynthesis polyprenyl glycosylphosphotransferase
MLLTDLVCLSLPALWDRPYYRALLAAAVISCLLFWAADLYRPRLQAFVLNETPALLGCLLAATAIVASASSIRHPTLGISRYLAVATQAIVLCMAGRAVVNLAIRQSRRLKLAQHRSIIVGSGPVAQRMHEILRSDPGYGLEVVGYVADQPEPSGTEPAAPYLGGIRTLRITIDQTGAEVVVISDEGFAEKELASIGRLALWYDCTVFIVPRLFELSHQSWQPDMIGPIPVVRFGRVSRTGFPWKCKRVFDIVVCSLALILLSPLLALCALAVRIDGGPGILFRQIRVGRDGQPFELLKFRSLRPVDEHESGTTWSIQNDDRLTPIGRFIRKTSLDELPQLWTILRGDMTIVGPRPERPHFVDKFSEEEPAYRLRHRVPAGLTGLAQVNGMRGDTSISERSYFDNYYIDNWSLWLDTKVILRTFSEVLFGSGG